MKYDQQTNPPNQSAVTTPTHENLHQNGDKNTTCPPEIMMTELDTEHTQQTDESTQSEPTTHLELNDYYFISDHRQTTIGRFSSR